MIRKQYVGIEVKEQRENGGRILINTVGLDRDRDHVMPLGAQIDNYMKNPVVQWGHNYRDPWATIGKTNSLELTAEGIVADFELRPPANETDPQNIVKLLWDDGWIRSASIGFAPADGAVRENDEGGHDYLAWELLEWSLVPVPANQEALRLAVKGLEQDGSMGQKSAVPFRDTGTASPTERWKKPRLNDFTDGSWADLNRTERRRIMGHFTWTANNPPEVYGDLKLPHHAPAGSGVGPAVWRGVTGSMAALLGARGGVNIPAGDRRAVYNHLVKHYKQFDKEPPSFKGYDEAELKLMFPDLFIDSRQTDNEIDNAGDNGLSINDMKSGNVEHNEFLPDQEAALAGALKNFLKELENRLRGNKNE